MNPSPKDARLYASVKETASEASTEPVIKSEQIAIVGIGCRFPGGANSPEAFWQLLRDGVDAITEVPRDRFDIDALYDPRPATPGKLVTRYGGFLEQIDQFDASFFGVAPREADHMDPQQRLLLEVAWEALEDAGLVLGKLQRSRTGVFIGMMSNDYEDLMNYDLNGLGYYTLNGGGRYGASGRLSYCLGLEGPSMTVDTACSSSMVAVHLACQSLRLGECVVALAGGANLILQPQIPICCSQAGILPPDGRCKFGDARADGFIGSEGIGIVVLKPLFLALADQDPIYAVIRGSAVNNDGRSGKAFGTPSRQTQEAVVRQAYRSAGISPGQVDYVEAHGTGTKVGDIIELQALATVLGEGRPKDRPCFIGSVKTNIGHTEGAAGVASVIKLALSLKHRAVPPSLHFQEPNPNIPWRDLPLVVQTEFSPWPARSTKTACAGLNSFGLSGTNAHMVVEEAPKSADVHKQAEWCVPTRLAHLLPLSGHCQEALRALGAAYQEFLAVKEADAEVSLQDVCYSASVRRAHHDHRLAVIGSSREEFIERLEAFVRGELDSSLLCGQRTEVRGNKLVFVFSGQGPQWNGMGRELLSQEVVFRATLEQIDALLRKYASWSLLEELAADDSRSRLNQTEIAQPAIFALQVSLAALWRSWGILPDAVVGHSVGEVAAAQVTGALSLEDAVRVIFHRGRIMQQATGFGKMASAELSFRDAERLVSGYEGRLSIAAINSPTSIVLSGETSALAEALRTLEHRGIFCRMLPVNYAFHSPQMEPLQGELVQALQRLSPRPASVPIVSTVTGCVSDNLDFDAVYWSRIKEPVLFAAAVEGLIEKGHNIFLEIGPHPVLAASISQCLSQRSGTVLASLRRGQTERATMLTALGTLYTQGYSVDWKKLYPSGGRCVRLPSYPWQRARYWIDRENRGTVTLPQHSAHGQVAHPLLGRRLDSPLHTFESQFSTRSLPILDDHRIYGTAVFPTAAYLEMTLAAAVEAFGAGTYILEDVIIHEALVFTEHDIRTVHLILACADSEKASFQIFSREGEHPMAERISWRLHAAGNVRFAQSNVNNDAETQGHLPLEDVRTRCQERMSGPAFYQRLKDHGFQFGSGCEKIEQIWRRDGEGLGQLQLPSAGVPEAQSYQIHPALLVAGFQLSFAAMPINGEQPKEQATYLPTSVKTLRIYGRPDTLMFAHVMLRSDSGLNPHTLVVDLQLCNETGKIAVEVSGMRLRPVEREVLLGNSQEPWSDWLYEIQWQPKMRLKSVLTSKQAEQERRGNWLIFADQGGAGTTLASLLKSRGESCTVVFPGKAYNVSEAGHFELNSANLEDFQRLLREVSGNGLPCLRGVVHLWSLNFGPPEKTTPNSLAQSLALSCGSALHLVKALVQMEHPELPRLWIVTRGAQPVTREPVPLALTQAPLWGLGRVIALEHPEIWGGLVDLDPVGCDDEASDLLAEIREPEHEDHLAFRRGRRYVARLVPSRSQRALGRPLPVVSDASYVITGGLGSLGLTVAGWLVKQGARHLMLVGRRGASSVAIEALKELEQVGAHVVVAKGDVSREEDVARLLAEIARFMPPLRGIVHAAGVLDDGVLLQQDWDQFARVMASKVAGAWNLHMLTKNMALDFFVLFSSAASLLGSLGQGNYAAANGFLDALAHHRRVLGLPALSINWGPWAGSGMAASLGSRDQRRWSEWGIGHIAPEQGLRVLGHLLPQDFAQIGVISVNWSKFIREFSANGTPPPLLSDLAREIGTSKEAERLPKEQPELLQKLMDLLPQDRLDILSSYIQWEVGKILGLDPSCRLDPNRGFFQMGMDSLMAVMLKNRLQTDLAHPFSSAGFIFNYPTVSSLAGYLAKEVLALPKFQADLKKDNDDMSTVSKDLENLSEDELAALLEEKLKDIP